MAKANGVSIAEIRFPVGGVVRRFGFQHQPPYTTPDALNVRPCDAAGGRERGGSRPGLVKAFSSQLGNESPIQMLATVAWLDANNVYQSTLVAVCNGIIYRTTAIGELLATGGMVSLQMEDDTPVETEAGATVKIAVNSVNSTAMALHAAEWGQKLYIADYDDAAAPPKVYNPADGTLSDLVASAGAVPLGCRLACRYRDRFVLAGPGNLWYMARQGDPTDFDYAPVEPEDPGRAISGLTADAGQIGEPIRALIPHTDDYLIFGCENSLWVLRGDAAAGGQIDALSLESGIVSSTAWCKLPDASVLILARQGVVLVPAGASGYPQLVSKEFLPRELEDVDTINNKVSMVYNHHENGVHIAVTPITGGAGTHWWFDWGASQKGFWRDSFPNGMQPYALAAYAPDPSEARNVIIGSYDGYLRTFDRQAQNDDGEVLSSWVKIGPLQLGGPGREGIIGRMTASLDAASNPVNWEVRTGATGQEAAETTVAAASGAWLAGKNPWSAPRTRGAAGVVCLSSTAQWALENLIVSLTPGGPQR